MEAIRHDLEVVMINFNRDGSHLLTCTKTQATVLDLQGNRVVESKAEEGEVVAAKFLSDGRSVFVAVSAADKSRIKVHSLDDGRTVNTIATGRMKHADMSDDGSRIVTVFGEKAYVWDPATGESVGEIRAKEHANLIQVRLNTDGSRIGMLSNDQWTRVWDTESRLPVSPEFEHDYVINGFRFTDRGDAILSWSNDSTARLWNLETNEASVEPMRHSNRVVHAEMGKLDGEDVCLATLSHLKSRTDETRTGSVQLWRIPDVKSPLDRGIGVDPKGFDSAVFSRDGRLLAMSKTGGQTWVQETETAKIVCGPFQVDGGAWGMEFVPDGSRLITAGPRGTVSRWSLPEGKLIGETVRFKTAFQPMEISLDGRCFATGSTDGFVRLWSAESGQVLWESKHGAEINSVAISPDGRLVASAGEDRVVRLWDSSTGKLHAEVLGHENEVSRVLFSPDGARLATASLDFTARIWDVSTSRQRHRLPHQGEVTDIDFSRDGKFLATGSRDRTAMIWEVESGRPQVHGLLHGQAIRNVRFSPDGTRLLVLDFNGPRLWDAATGHPLTVHFPHWTLAGIGFQSKSQGPAFTPDESLFMVGQAGLQVEIWDCQVPSANIPDWFPEFLEAVAGQRIAPGVELPIRVEPQTFLTLRERIRQSTNDDFYTRWARDWSASGWPSSTTKRAVANGLTN